MKKLPGGKEQYLSKPRDLSEQAIDYFEIEAGARVHDGDDISMAAIK